MRFFCIVSGLILLSFLMNTPHSTHHTTPVAPARGSDNMLTAIFAMLALMIALNIFGIYFLMGNTLNLG